MLDDSEIVTHKLTRRTWIAMWSPSDTVTYRRFVGKGLTADEAKSNLLKRSQLEVIKGLTATELQPSENEKTL
jgi:hypothetical protein